MCQFYFYIRRALVLFSLGNSFPYLSYLFLVRFIVSILLTCHPFIEHRFNEKQFHLLDFEKHGGVLFFLIVLYTYDLSCLPHYFVKRSRFVLLTPFSSTTKRSLQPHNDKLLIGSQQFLTSAMFSALAFPWPYLAFIFVLQFSILGFYQSYLAMLEQRHFQLFLV